jgi:hypothetical protein
MELVFVWLESLDFRRDTFVGNGVAGVLSSWDGLREWFFEGVCELFWDGFCEFWELLLFFDVELLPDFELSDFDLRNFFAETHVTETII